MLSRSGLLDECLTKVLYDHLFNLVNKHFVSHVVQVNTTDSGDAQIVFHAWSSKQNVIGIQVTILRKVSIIERKGSYYIHFLVT